MEGRAHDPFLNNPHPQCLWVPTAFSEIRVREHKNAEKESFLLAPKAHIPTSFQG